MRTASRGARSPNAASVWPDQASLQPILADAVWPAEAIAHAATLACRLEAGAAKPGNVTPAASFPEMSHADFVASAEAIGPVMGAAGSRKVGETVLLAVEATRAVARANTNLGTVLLLAPLARAAAVARAWHGGEGAAPDAWPGPNDRRTGLREALGGVLEALDVEDADLAYRAIRLAAPGGMGRVSYQDVSGRPDVTLLEAMRSAAERDTVAREYATVFAVTFETGVPLLEAAPIDGSSIAESIVDLYLELLSRMPDSLVERKFGRPAAGEVTKRAAAVLAAGPSRSRERLRAAEELDAWLRAASHGWNPGTTADLVAATLFVWLLTSDAGTRLAAETATPSPGAPAPLPETATPSPGAPASAHGGTLSAGG